MQIYVLMNDQQHGPYSPADVRQFLATGQLQPTDQAWHEGLAEWRPLAAFPEFADVVRQRPVAASPATAKTARKSKAPIYVSLGLASLALCGVIGWFLWTRPPHVPASSKAPPDAPLAANPAEAEPKTLDELNRWYVKPPPGQNAATYFLQGFDAVQMTAPDTNSPSLPVFGKGKMPPLGSPLPESMRTALAGFLQRNRAALELFAQGTSCAGSRYAVDLTQGYGTPLPHLARVKQAAQIVSFSALAQADRQQGQSAADSVIMGLALARSLESEPILLSQLVRLACLGVTEVALEQTINRAALSPETLARLQTAVDRAAESETSGAGLHRALVGELVIGLAAVDLPPEKLIGSPANGTRLPDDIKSLVPAAARNREADRRFWEETLRQALTAHRAPFPQRLKADQVFAARQAEARSRQLFFSAVMDLGSPVQRAAEGLARLRLAQAAIALERFRAAHDSRYPAALAELAPNYVPAVPADPFDGQPLRYRQAGEGYQLYSVGPDMKDDSGEDKKGSAGDIVFKVVLPPKRP